MRLRFLQIGHSFGSKRTTRSSGYVCNVTKMSNQNRNRSNRNRNRPIRPTSCGGGGIGSESSDLALVFSSLEYHQSRNCTKNRPRPTSRDRAKTRKRDRRRNAEKRRAKTLELKRSDEYWKAVCEKLVKCANGSRREQRGGRDWGYYPYRTPIPTIRGSHGWGRSASVTFINSLRREFKFWREFVFLQEFELFTKILIST